MRPLRVATFEETLAYGGHEGLRRRGLLPPVAGGAGAGLFSAGASLTSASGGSATPAYGRTPVAGNLLVLFNGGNSTTISATPAGWSSATGSGASGAFVQIFYKVAVGGDAQPTIAAQTGVVLIAQLAEFGGITNNSPLDQNGTNNGVGASVVATSGAANLQPAELVVMRAGSVYSTSAARTMTNVPNNGLSWNFLTNSSGTTGQGFVQVGWGIATGATTGPAVADSTNYTVSSTTGLTASGLCIASFLLAPSPWSPRAMPTGV